MGTFYWLDILNLMTYTKICHSTVSSGEEVRILRMKKIMILEIVICLISVTNKLPRKSLRYK